MNDSFNLLSSSLNDANKANKAEYVNINDVSDYENINVIGEINSGNNNQEGKTGSYEILVNELLNTAEKLQKDLDAEKEAGSKMVNNMASQLQINQDLQVQIRFVKNKLDNLKCNYDELDKTAAESATKIIELEEKLHKLENELSCKRDELYAKELEYEEKTDKMKSDFQEKIDMFESHFREKIGKLKKENEILLHNNSTGKQESLVKKLAFLILAITLFSLGIGGILLFEAMLMKCLFSLFTVAGVYLFKYLWDIAAQQKETPIRRYNALSVQKETDKADKVKENKFQSLLADIFLTSIRERKDNGMNRVKPINEDFLPNANTESLDDQPEPEVEVENKDILLNN